MSHLRSIAFVMIGIALGIAAPAIAQQAKFRADFPDVPTEAYFADPVQNLFRKGIIRGYDSGDFGPDDVVTRAQVATMIDRYDREVVEQLREQIDQLRQHAGLGSCGDGKAQSIEQCDDGNNQDGDGCSSVCTKEVSNECFGHTIGESFMGPDGCNRCTCTENGMACTKMFCPPKDDEKKCMSSDQCVDGKVCSTEYGDCMSACPPGAEVCPAVCAGICVPKREEAFTCGDGICSAGEDVTCPPGAQCIWAGCPQDCGDDQASSCQDERLKFGDVPSEYLRCDDDADCTTFIQGCPFLTCGMAVNLKGESYLQTQADRVIATCEKEGEPQACAKCAVHNAFCVRGMCSVTQPTAR